MCRGVLSTQRPMGWQGSQPGSESIHVTHWICKERHCPLSGLISCFGLAVQLILAVPDQLEAIASGLCRLKFAFAAATAFQVSNPNDVGFGRSAAGALRCAQALQQSCHAERPGSSLAVHVSPFMNIVVPFRLPSPQSEVQSQESSEAKRA